jgi:hypothetical protein
MHQTVTGTGNVHTVTFTVQHSHLTQCPHTNTPAQITNTFLLWILDQLNWNSVAAKISTDDIIDMIEQCPKTWAICHNETLKSNRNQRCPTTWAPNVALGTQCVPVYILTQCYWLITSKINRICLHTESWTRFILRISRLKQCSTFYWC